MTKKFVLVFVMLLVIFIFGCEKTEYEKWRNSDEAIDLNGDKKITEEDYELFKNPPQSDYEKWRNSDEAEDLNGDRKINEEDYELYKNPPLSEYEKWKNSKDAVDLNNDGKINEEDYVLYKNPPLSDYEKWRNSDEAEDLNGDRKIDEEDYELYKNPPLSEYEKWKISDKAEDLNNDGKINEADYGLYLLRSEFTGEYYIADYTYEGSQTIYFGNTLALKDLAETLYQVRFIVDNDGNVDAIIPSKVLASLGDDAAMVFDGLKNMTITRLSKYLVVIDTDVLLEGVDFKFTLYLTEIEGGFSTSYSMNFNGKISVMSFNIMKE